MARYCHNCGNEVDEKAYVCVKCGAQLQPTSASPSANTNPNAKSKILAGLLGIFLGGLGVHNFYLGYTGKGVAQLLITILSLGFLSGISYVWGLIEGIMILVGSINVDAQGVPLKD